MANVIPYGFYDLQGLFAQRAATTDNIRQVNTAVDRSIVQHTQKFNQIMSLLVRRTTEYKVLYKTPGAGESQPGDENGRYLPTQGGSSYDVALPIQQSGNAMGYNRITGAKLTVQEVAERTAEIIKGDQKWVYRRVLASLFYNAAWTFTDKQYGALTIKPMANGDGDMYYRDGVDSLLSDNHFYAQAGAISDAANPFPTISEELTEHPENGGDAIAFVSTTLVPSIQGLAGFVPVGDPRILQGVTADRLIGTPARPVPGQLVGRVDNTWIVKWKEIDAGYGFAITENGEPPIGMREHPEAELQGFQRLGTREDIPFTEFQFERLAGFGGWSRLSAVPFLIGNSTYTPPTRFAALPIP